MSPAVLAWQFCLSGLARQLTPQCLHHGQGGHFRMAACVGVSDPASMRHTRRGNESQNLQRRVFVGCSNFATNRCSGRGVGSREYDWPEQAPAVTAVAARGHVPAPAAPPLDAGLLSIAVPSASKLFRSMQITDEQRHELHRQIMQSLRRVCHESGKLHEDSFQPLVAWLLSTALDSAAKDLHAKLEGREKWLVKRQRLPRGASEAQDPLQLAFMREQTRMNRARLSAAHAPGSSDLSPTAPKWWRSLIP